MKQIRIQRQTTKRRVQWEDEQHLDARVDADTSAATEVIRRIDDLLDEAG